MLQTPPTRNVPENRRNRSNWGDPQVNFNAGTFGRITTQAGAPRIMQFGVKYDL